MPMTAGRQRPARCSRNKYSHGEYWQTNAHQNVMLTSSRSPPDGSFWMRVTRCCTASCDGGPATEVCTASCVLRPTRRWSCTARSTMRYRTLLLACALGNVHALFLPLYHNLEVALVRLLRQRWPAAAAQPRVAVHAR